MRAFLAAVPIALVLASPAVAQSGPRLGAYYGADLGADPHPGNHHVGLLYAAPAFGVFEVYPALEVFFDRLADGSVWQASLNLRARPKRSRGEPSAFYAGGGLNVRSDIFEPGLLMGIEAPWDRARPFFEFRFFGTDIDRASYNVIAGATLALH